VASVHDITLCKADGQTVRRQSPQRARLSSSLFVNAGGGDLFGARVLRIDGASGRRDVWKEYTPGDVAGLTVMRPEAISADGKTLIIFYQRSLSIPYLGEGIR
jgi:hypothetical protein